LELSRTLMRAFRRAEIPLAYSEGFHPMPRLAFASALAVGVESNGEYLDFETTRPISVGAIRERINACLPSGLGLEEIGEVMSGAQSLGDLINAARYTARFESPLPAGPLQES